MLRLASYEVPARTRKRGRVPLALATIAVLPLVAFAFLWTTLLLMLGGMWLLETTGFF
jgi:hypothetical protein